ncbi:MAG TPA: hypothetical protein VFE24_03775 [Pirellulales bacterium]|jgi:hypothetical protein|nr:hypothetical protein [Pirellulales bacterium]
MDGKTIIDETEQRKLFGRLAFQYIELIRTMDIPPGTEVFILFHCLDSDGRHLPPFREEATSCGSEEIPGESDVDQQQAEEDRRQAIESRVNLRIRELPAGFFDPRRFFIRNEECRARTESEVFVESVTLEIFQPAEKSKPGEKLQTGPLGDEFPFVL